MPMVQHGARELNSLLYSSMKAGGLSGQPTDVAEARAWDIAEAMGWKTEDGWAAKAADGDQVQETPSFIVYRVAKAEEFVPGTFTAEDVDVSKGIRAIRARVKKSGKPGTLSMYFLRSKGWDSGKVVKYMKDNEGE